MSAMNSPAGCQLKSHQRPVAAHMLVFDKLPLELRRALAEARGNYCPMCARDAWRRYGPELAVQLVAESERSATT